MKSIIEIIERRIENNTCNTSFTFLKDDKDNSKILLSEIREKANIIATYLPKNKSVLILLPQEISFIESFLACLYAQAIAVPVSMPTKHRGLEKLQHIICNANISWAITNRTSFNNLNKWFGEEWLTEIKWQFVEELIESKRNISFQLPKPEQIAFLQFTSGSTSQPKAVIVTHENIMANSKIIQKCFQNTSKSVSVCWLPSYHDMGLIDGIIQPIYSNFSSIILSPIYFLQSPIRWFKAITDYRATYSGGPNFAFDFCTERIKNEELKSIDLSSLSCLYNGSEPIKAITIRKFVEQFSKVGFEEKMIFNCYGLAEATLAVTTTKLGKYPKIIKVQIQQNKVELAKKTSFVELVSCGKIYCDTGLKIVNNETLDDCNEREIGEIWVSGKSIASGYRNFSKQTKQTFINNNNIRFLRTGDLGFIHQNELFVTGRIKDLIIIRGKNHYPQDIEQTVSSAHASLQSNSCAAFSVEQEMGEKLVIVQEIKRSFLKSFDFQNTKSTVLSRIILIHGLSPIDVVFIKPGGLPKTTSGKIQRDKCKQMWLNKNFEVLNSL